MHPRCYDHYLCLAEKIYHDEAQIHSSVGMQQRICCEATIDALDQNVMSILFASFGRNIFNHPLLCAVYIDDPYAGISKYVFVT